MSVPRDESGENVALRRADVEAYNFCPQRFRISGRFLFVGSEGEVFFSSYLTHLRLMPEKRNSNQSEIIWLERAYFSPTAKARNVLTGVNDSKALSEPLALGPFELSIPVDCFYPC